MSIKHICSDITQSSVKYTSISSMIGINRTLTSGIHFGKISPLIRFTHNLNGPKDVGAGHIALAQTTGGSIHTLGNG